MGVEKKTGFTDKTGDCRGKSQEKKTKKKRLKAGKYCK
jgi:hypothetical protein